MVIFQNKKKTTVTRLGLGLEMHKTENRFTKNLNLEYTHH